MPAEHIRPKGLSQGYFCHNCGKPCNMMATGHHGGKCESNPKLVAELIELNKPKKELPKFPTDNLYGDTFRHNFSYIGEDGNKVSVGVSLRASVYGDAKELARIENDIKENAEKNRKVREAFYALSKEDQLTHHLQKIVGEVKEVIKMCSTNVRYWDETQTLEDEVKELRELRSAIFCKLDFAMCNIPQEIERKNHFTKLTNDDNAVFPENFSAPLPLPSFIKKKEDEDEENDWFAHVGDKVEFLDKNGLSGHLDDARKLFVLGQILTVKEVEIGSWCSYYTFEEVDGEFNTVMFDKI